MIEKASIIREKRKSVKITISREGDITIYCPYGLALDKVESILKSKEKLLEKKINKARVLSSKFSSVMKLENILLFGKEYVIVPTNKVSKPSFTEEYFLLPKKYYESGKTTFYIKKIVKEIADRVIVKRFKDIIQNYKYDVSKIIIGSYRAKWGSCDRFGVIKLNWRLAMVKPKLIDFVIFHELTHLKELNHSPRFYMELEKVCPTWKESRDELKNYAFLLEMY